MRAVVSSQSGANNFVSTLLCFNVDCGVDRQTTLSDASGVLVFQFLTNVLDRIIKGDDLRCDW